MSKKKKIIIDTDQKLTKAKIRKVEFALQDGDQGTQLLWSVDMSIRKKIFFCLEQTISACKLLNFTLNEKC